MQDFTDKILYKTHQHIIVLISKFLSIFLPFLLLSYIGFLFTEIGLLWRLLIELVAAICIFGWFYFFWVKSYFMISNEKIIVKVRNGLFSKFHMSIHFKNIRDMAYAKNNIMHYLLNYGTVFARSSAGAGGDLEAKHIPKVESVYKILDILHSMDEKDRKQITSLEQISQAYTASQLSKDNPTYEKPINETLEAAIEKEKQVLLSIRGLKEVVLLDGKDRKYIFEHEEEKNHGVHECLRREVLFAATHDSTLRDPDEAIVMQSREKVIFPVVEFHEIVRKKVSSSSPGLLVHTYLVPKFQNFDEYDATLLIGFNV